MERSIWSHCAIISCMSTDERVLWRICCRICPQWAIIDWWSMPVMLWPGIA